MKKRLILILNGKGGVGKSFFAVNFVQYLKDHEISHAAFDSDDENSTIKRFHSEAQFIDAGQPTEIDKVTFALADSDIVVVDCRAASTRIFLNYFEETRLTDILEHLGARLTIACPVNHELDSIYQIQKLVNAIGGKVVLACGVTASGALAGCQVLSESPGNQGFGRAALKLAAFFRLSPRTENGRPIDGAIVHIPLVFNAGE